MNSYSSYHSSSSDILLKRFRLWKRQYLHVVIYTSLFWIFIDVFFIMLFSDCTKQVIIPCSSSIETKERSTNDNNSNYIESIDDNLSRHPKFNFDKIQANNRTKLRRKTILNRKTIDQSKKINPGFMAKWFGSDSGLKMIFPRKIFIFYLVYLKRPIQHIGLVKVVVLSLFQLI